MRWRWTQATIVLAILIPLLWSFGSTLTGARVCAYRDTAHFYYPLYAWTTRCWSQGEIPLWNPQENIGTPVAAEATSAVFYPGQLIFALPGPYSTKFNLYLMVHVVLAAVGAYVLTRHVSERNAHLSSVGPNRSASLTPTEDSTQLQRLGAGLSGLSYAFGGAVLFQYCNIVFLVGAAWLPWTLLAADRMLATRRLSWTVALGGCLALMVLGGDPQMAYHAGLLAALLAWLRWRASQTPSSAPSNAPPTTLPHPTLPRYRHALLLLATAAVVGMLLSAMQIVPAVAWTRQSERASFCYPRSVFEIHDYVSRPTETESLNAPQNGPGLQGARAVREGLVGKPEGGTHHAHLYDFSLAPWRVAELLWPNVSGHMFPVNQRWLSALGGEDRIWTPTLYLGIMPLLIALATWRLRTSDPHLRWLSLVAVGALIASFGWYGLGWIASEIQGLWTGNPPTLAIGAPTGGLYWLMVKLLPGYAYFRYPAKLLVIAALAVAVLAGTGFPHALTAGRRQASRFVAVVAGGSVLAAIAFAACGPWWADWFTGATPDELFGPLDASGAWRGGIKACLHTSLLCSVFWWMLRRSPWSPYRLGQIIVLVTAVEIAWANGAHVVTAPAAAMQVATVLDALDRPQQEPTGHIQRFYRPPRRSWVPPQWRQGPDSDRVEQTVQWDRATLFPKYHLLGAQGSVQSMNTITSRDYRTLLRRSSSNYVPQRVLDLLGVQYLVLPADTAWPGGQLVPSNLTAVDNAKVWENSSALPRAWLVHDVEFRKAEDSSDPQTTQRQVRHLLFPQNVPRDLQRSAVVDATTAKIMPSQGATDDESCRVVTERTCRVDVEARLASPGLLVLSNQYDPGWSVTAITDDSRWQPELVRTNTVMQGVFLPAGTHRLEFQYVPRGFYIAASSSIAGWLFCLALCAWRVWKREGRE